MKVKSKRPNKQRKYLHSMALHERKKKVKGHLSKELRKELKKRSIGLRKGDEVKIMRGSNKGFKGKIARVDRTHAKVFIEKLSRKKADGTEILMGVTAAKLMVLSIAAGREEKTQSSKTETKTTGKANKKEDIWAEDGGDQ
ncbi:MAG: 50S ribosomal protein L24 [archaeon]|nr:50S ribosomal protein L24 [archaeon]